MDLLQGVQDAAAGGEEAAAGIENMGDFQMPSMEQLMELINTMDMSEEEKLKLLNDISGINNDARGRVFQEAFDGSMHGGNISYSLVLFAFLVIVSLLGFFTYKLLKSYTDKEKKMEARRKNKQSKKKK